jgi:ribosomal protein L16/L10AE
LTSDAESPRNEFLYYTSRGIIEGIRQDKWKLLVKKPGNRRNGKGKGKGKQQSAKAVLKPEVMLFDLDADMGEQNNLADANPEVVEKLQARMLELDAEIEKNARPTWVKPGA